MYNRIYNKFTEDMKQKQKEYKALNYKKENLEQDDTERIKNIVKEFLSLKNPTPEVMRVIINRIEIHQDKQIDIKFNFKRLNELKK